MLPRIEGRGLCIGDAAPISLRPDLSEGDKEHMGLGANRKLWLEKLSFLFLFVVGSLMCGDMEIEESVLSLRYATGKHWKELLLARLTVLERLSLPPGLSTTRRGRREFRVVSGGTFIAGIFLP